MGFVLRWMIAFALIALTYNPTRWNYSAWVGRNWPDQMPLAVLLGLLLFVGYVIYLRATLRSIGPFGMGLVIAVFGALVWVLVDFGVVSLDNPGLNTWLGIFALSLVLGIGLSWSIVRRRLSGQADVDDVED
ncbi:hypothetical protein OB2597_00725 [Pseudooceanicola batsensis HTCC2597]|uniref:Uncharacterized protein n=1 Tax=Pseudooceanicola batsensis (strain ATCC BAA-863 / DSM 15984 / KCTC 12145 / HTCC2597) TaxID=252305 RepID=A3U1W2_PSEBH|nr:DUF6524 family protein [Pseudooceanicola batsensis]EAQ01896.1 hypothetical protein OB2597_00725 [Pseudooceanicola batsensis HTCC2597]